MMNNKALIFAEHYHRLTKFDFVAVTVTLIITAMISYFAVSPSSVETNTDQSMLRNTITEVE